ncbi:MAG: hypothetical protein ACR2QC_07655, partial [Gammaproteobacteria bacterium]
GTAGEKREFAGRRMRFRLSPEWRCFYILGYRRIRYCPQKQKETAIPAKAGISAPKARNSLRKKNRKKIENPAFFYPVL